MIYERRVWSDKYSTSKGCWKKRRKNVGQVMSRERRELVMQVGIICANSINALPPIWVLRRVHFDEHPMMSGET